MDQQNFDKLRLRLALRKSLLNMRDCAAHRSALVRRFTWCTLGLFDEVIAECTQEGLISVQKGRNGGDIIVWHENKVPTQE
jgi:hypothetical protein